MTGGNRNLILKAPDKRVALEDLFKFVNYARKNGLSKDAEAEWGVTNAGVLRFWVVLPPPEEEPVKKRRVIVTKKTLAKRAAVAKQIAEHKKLKEKGQAPAYVPPVGGKKKQLKRKCPVCNWKKPVVHLNGIRIFRPHTSKGEKCPGGGRQYTPSKGKK